MNPYTRHPKHFDRDSMHGNFQHGSGYGNTQQFNLPRHPVSNFQYSSRPIHQPPLQQRSNYHAGGPFVHNSHPQYLHNQSNVKPYGYGHHDSRENRGHWHGRGRGFKRNEAYQSRQTSDGISVYFKPSMLSDPWKDLMDKLKQDE